MTIIIISTVLMFSLLFNGVLWFLLRDERKLTMQELDRASRIEMQMMFFMEYQKKFDIEREGKRKVFKIEPFPPYTAGDLWNKGEKLLVCVISKPEKGTFSQSDWIVAKQFITDLEQKKIDEVIDIVFQRHWDNLLQPSMANFQPNVRYKK